MTELISKREVLEIIADEVKRTPEFIKHEAQLDIDVKVRALPVVSEKEIRDKVIDEFARKFIYKAVCSGCSGCTNCYEEERQYECENWKSYMEIAGQMKAMERLAKYEETGLTPEEVGRDKWISADTPPKTNDYILLSFANFSGLMIGRYEEDEEGGAYCLGDEDVTALDYGLFVNAWQQLPEPYKEESRWII